MDVPLYIEEMRVKGGTEYKVQALFAPETKSHGQLLSRETARVMHALREVLNVAGRSPRHDELMEWSYCPEMTTEIINAPLLLRHTTMRLRLMVVAFPSTVREKRGARVAFSPSVPWYWFDVAPGEDLEKRAVEAYTAYWKEVEKEEGASFRAPSMESFVRGWVSIAEVTISPKQRLAKQETSLLAALMGAEKLSGQEELNKVARRIDSLYPEELDRAVMRDAEVQELARVMAAGDKRPVLLVGPPLVGKTTIVHEYVYRRRQGLRGGEYAGSLWLISPQRLISGMMYAGQWENRLLAILDHLKETRQVLYVDDLPGFYHAGISASSSLSAAQVLRPYVERRDVRVVAEITPESLRVLQERDRGFADLFHIIPVREPGENEARRLLLTVLRQLEGLHRSRFGVEALPMVMELVGRYVRDLALPGKAAVFLKDLATKYGRAAIGRDEVLQEFHSKSGLSVRFLDRTTALVRQAIEEGLRKTVIGQEEAVRAMTDVVSVARAQLNDPGRPLGSFLFLGPTGVGKTQAAKALAKYLFGDAERMLRFDMNEYLDPWSAQRLVGTWDQPSGLLTSAVRRQPFSVILLDEIEKAHPAVFDLLLQVLGEGRLTDALGRTSDFGNTIIIMTSNLGVREAEQRFGFGSEGGSDRAAAFRQAAQGFFRPEFYNRIDRIVPFERLSREQTRLIASELIGAVLEREGLRQRKCVLSVMPAAMERIVDAGYQPELGARALKRAIERQVTAPVAGELAAIEPGTPTLIDVYPKEAGIGVRVRGLTYAQRMKLPEVADHAAAVERIDAALDRLHEATGRLRPKGRVVVGELTPEQVRYFAMKEQLEKIERLLERFEKGQEKPRGGGRRISLKAKEPIKRARVNVRALQAALDLRQYVNDLAETTAAEREAPQEALLDIVREVSLLEAMARSGKPQVVLVMRVMGGALSEMRPLFRFYFRLGWRVLDLTPQLQERKKRTPVLGQMMALVLEHAAAEELGDAEAGVHLVIGQGEQLHPVLLTPVALQAGEDPVEKVLEWVKKLEAWQEALGSGKATLEDDPAPLGEIVRIFDQHVLDLRSALVGDDGLTEESKLMRQAMVLAALPLPAEVEEA